MLGGTGEGTLETERTTECVCVMQISKTPALALNVHGVDPSLCSGNSDDLRPFQRPSHCAGRSEVTWQASEL